MSVPSREVLEAEILRQANERGPNGSIGPSDVARALAVDWRPLLTPIRQAAFCLSRAGRIDILRKGKAVSPTELRGVIRLRIRG